MANLLLFSGLSETQRADVMRYAREMRHETDGDGLLHLQCGTDYCIPLNPYDDPDVASLNRLLQQNMQIDAGMLVAPSSTLYDTLIEILNKLDLPEDALIRKLIGCDQPNAEQKRVLNADKNRAVTNNNHMQKQRPNFQYGEHTLIQNPSNSSLSNKFEGLGIQGAVNSWDVQHANMPAVRHNVGSFFGKNSLGEKNREGVYPNNPAQPYINHLMQDRNQNNGTHILLDIRLLDSTEATKFIQHRDTMDAAVTTYNRDNQQEGKRLQYLCLHAPTTSGMPHLLGHRSLTDKQNYQAQSNTIRDALMPRINQHNDSKKLTQLLDMALENMKPPMNASKALMLDTYMTILGEKLGDGVDVIASCKSAKDRASAEVVAMLAWREVTLKAMGEDKLHLLDNIVVGNKIDAKKLRPEYMACFCDNFNPALLYVANHENTGIWTNINAREMFDHVLIDFKDHPKFSHYYDRHSPSS